MAIIFAVCVIIATAGILWFHIIRPILEDFGVIRVEESVKDYEETPAAVMSRPEDGDDDDHPVRIPVRSAPAPEGAASFDACESPRTPRTLEDTSALLSVLKMTPEETAVIRKMFYYQRTEARLGRTPGKAATILAATGVKKSGDPKSSYAKWAAIYDVLLGEPEPAEKYPERIARMQPSVVERN